MRFSFLKGQIIVLIMQFAASCFAVENDTSFEMDSVRLYKQKAKEHKVMKFTKSDGAWGVVGALGVILFVIPEPVTTVIGGSLLGSSGTHFGLKGGRKGLSVRKAQGYYKMAHILRHSNLNFDNGTTNKKDYRSFRKFYKRFPNGLWSSEEELKEFIVDWTQKGYFKSPHLILKAKDWHRIISYHQGFLPEDPKAKVLYDRFISVFPEAMEQNI